MDMKKVLTANKWLIGAASAALIGGATLWEGVRYVPYYDVAGVPTVCMGYTGTGITFGKRYSHEECTKLLKQELIEHGNGVLSCITRPMKENEYNAFTLMAYNIGVKAFCGSTTAKLFNSGNTSLACDRIAFSSDGSPNWSYAGGKFYKGLHNRRLYERLMCKGGVDAST